MVTLLDSALLRRQRFFGTPRVWLLASLCLLTPILLLIGLANYLGFPYQGFEFSRDLVGLIDPTGPAATAGMRLGDEIIAINGRPFASWDGPYIAPNDAGAWYTIKRAGQQQDIYVRFGPDSAAFVMIKMMYYAAGLGFWAIGALLLFLRTRDERASLLILCCFIAALTLGALTFADLGADWASRLTAVLLMMVSPLFVHYHSIFPERKSLGGHRRALLGGLYAISFALILARGSFPAAFLNEIGAFALLSVLMRLFLSLCILLGLALLVHTQLNTTDMLIKRQASLMVLGTGLSAAAMIVVVVGPQLVGGTYWFPTYFVFWMLFLIPLSYAYTTYRHRLMNIDPKVNRTVVLVTLALVVIAAYGALWELISRLTPRFFPSIGPEVAGLIAVLVIGFGITPLKDGIQKLADKAFYGGWYSYRSIVDKVARNLNLVRDIDALAQELVDGLTADMRVQSAVLIVPNDTQLDFQVQKAIGFGDNLRLMPRIRTDGVLARYLARHGEPIDHAQLVSSLQDSGNITRDELAQWKGVQLWVPLVKDGALEGILVLGLKQVEDFFDAEDRHILSTLANQAAVALQNVHLIDELKRKVIELDRLYHELQLVREEEQTRLGHDIHDTIIQGLVAMNIRVRMGIADTHIKRQVMMGLSDDIDQTISDLRSMCAELHSPVLDEFGLTAAIKDYMARLADDVETVVEADLPTCEPEWLTLDQRICLYRVLQEGLANARQHSQASHIGVKLTFNDANVVMSVRDDGVGFIVPERLGSLVKGNHFGLAGMEQRVSSFGGILEIVSKPSQGTYLQVQLQKQPMVSPMLVVERRNGWNHSIPTS